MPDTNGYQLAGLDKASKTSVGRALEMYARGAFLMGVEQGTDFGKLVDADDDTILWVSHSPRGGINLNDFHIPKKLKKELRKNSFEITIDQDFEKVVELCGDRDSTWLTDATKRIVFNIFKAGFAHSVEVRRQGKLIGGLYGITLGGVFFGESIFNLEPNTGKIAMCHLVARLRVGGFEMLDSQMLVGFTEQMGGKNFGLDEFYDKLHHSLPLKANFFCNEEDIENEFNSMIAALPNGN